MADTTQLPINGTYHVQPAYPDSYNHAHTAVNSVSNFQPAQSSTPSNAPSNDQKNGISKDEVGWYFVEQYYTNMSRSPDKLHLFYSRRSQLVFGTEAESVPVAVGQKVRLVSLSSLCMITPFAIADISTSSRLFKRKSNSLISRIAKFVS
jgi:hypothetical protein